MNLLIINGRLTREPETKTMNNGNLLVKFSVAVDREWRDQSGNKVTDFIDWTAFGKTAEFVAKYFHKGDGIVVSGRLQNDNYTGQDGKTIYRNSCIAEKVQFGVGSKSSGQNTAPAAAAPVASDEFLAVPDDVDDGLPFN